MRKWIVRLMASAMLCWLSGCAYPGASRPPWLNSVWAPQPVSYSYHRHSHSSQRVRSARNHSEPREPSPTSSPDVSAPSTVADRAASPPAAVSNSPVSLTLAGDSGDRDRAQQLLQTADANLVRAHARHLSAAEQQTYERASQLAHRARRALADNDCAAASSLAGKASSLAAGINGGE